MKKFFSKSGAVASLASLLTLGSPAAPEDVLSGNAQASQTSVSQSNPNLERTVENEDIRAKIGQHYDEAFKALLATPENRGMYRVAIDNCNKGLALINQHNVGKDFENGFHLYAARASSKTGKIDQMFEHYLQVLVKGREGGIMNGALMDIFEMHYNNAYKKTAKKQMDQLQETKKNKIRAELLKYGVGIYLGARPGSETKEAGRVRQVNEIFGFMKHPNSQRAVDYLVSLQLVKEGEFQKAEPNILLPYRVKPSKFQSLEEGNPTIAAVHKAILLYLPKN